MSDADIFLTTCRTRLPFRFGSSTMTWAPLCLLRVRIETGEGTTCDGFSSDLLVPKWFDKNPTITLREDCQHLIASVRRAAATAVSPASEPGSAFTLWRRLYEQCVAAAPEERLDPLVHGFGVALVERATIDAVCRAARRSFFEALKQDLLGFDPVCVHSELADWRLGEALPNEPLKSVQVRHTVGLLDALRQADIEPDTRADDGYPESLEESIERYGVELFKIKLSGEREFDERRLLQIAGVLRERVRARPRFTLDGNEQFESLADLHDLLRAVAKHAVGRKLLDGLLYVEQPLARAHTFDVRRNAAMPAIGEFAPLMIDEADADVRSFKRAIELGYRGVSVKNCKGVFRALLNFGLCRQLGGELFQSSEDLTNLPVVALQQDLATAAALGLEHSERNGHHYFAGLAHLPEQEALDALTSHPDLYERNAGDISLRIRDGAIAIDSLQRPGFGFDLSPRADERMTVDDWRFPPG